MERYQKIAQHREFKDYIEEIRTLEKERIYCCHGLEHLLDVARIMYIRALEEQYDLSKDLIYAAAFLHDIGKVEQYKEGIPHERIGAEKAGLILLDCGYRQEEITRIEEAISGHRRGNGKKGDILAKLLYEVDKGSRMCMFCQARNDCNWTKDEKNNTICY